MRLLTKKLANLANYHLLADKVMYGLQDQNTEWQTKLPLKSQKRQHWKWHSGN